MKNIWDFWAVRYERLWVQKYSLAPTRRLVIDELKKLIGVLGPGPKLNLLDVGCGTGQLIEDIANELGTCFATITGIDTAKNMVEIATQKKIPQAHFSHGDAENLPFANAQFDIVTCCHSFPYYRDKLQALQEFKRVLRPDGYIFLISASENNIYDKIMMALVKLTTGRATYPSSQDLAKLLKASDSTVLRQKNLPSKFFMPSIILTISRLERTL
jgi:ubiquinone/menaquinone biosynthesis C-methylase UbiE